MYFVMFLNSKLNSYLLVSQICVAGFLKTKWINSDYMGCCVTLSVDVFANCH